MNLRFYLSTWVSRLWHRLRVGFGHTGLSTQSCSRLVAPWSYKLVPRNTYDLIPKGQYDVLKKGEYVFGPVDKYLLVPKNRYRVVLLPDQSPNSNQGIGWLTEANTPAAYDQLWGDPKALESFRSEADNARDRLTREIVDHLMSLVGESAEVVDIGCGVGDLLLEVRRRRPGVRVYGCDFSEFAVEGARAALPDGEFLQHTIGTALPYDSARFDVVLCTDVIEHIEHPRQVVAELVRICRPGGVVIVVVPDGDVDQFLGHYWFWNEHAFSRFVFEWGGVVRRLPETREFLAILPGFGTTGRFGANVEMDADGNLRRVEAFIKQRPLELSIETVNICNAKCKFCAYPKVIQQKTIMSMELFKKICTEFSDMGGGLFGFAPLLGDSLVDPMLLDRLEYVKRFPQLKLHLWTNGIAFSRLSDEKLKDILSSLTFLNISLGGLTREHYKEMFGVDKFEEVWYQLERISNIYKQSQSSCRLAVHLRSNRPLDTISHPRYGLLGAMGYQVRGPVSAFNNWGGIVDQSDLPDGATIINCSNREKKNNCLIPNIILTILPNGDVTACGCFAVGKKYVVGNVESQTLLEVWNSDEYLKFKNSFSRGQVADVCAGCSSYIDMKKLFEKEDTFSCDLLSGDYWTKL
jgi:radical SAM protein with 4Fe4S-binding SPASM domain